MSARCVQIVLRDVRAYGRHGADPREREHRQALDLEVRIEADVETATDELAGTIDYAAVYSRIVRIVEDTSFALLERLGEAILGALLSDPRVRTASVTIAKPKLLAGATPSVTLTASRAPGE